MSSHINKGDLMEKNNIYILKDYGKVEIVLKDLLLKKGISRNKLCTMIATNYDLVNRYYNNKVIRVDTDILARICYALDCNINDLLKYKK